MKKLSFILIFCVFITVLLAVTVLAYDVNVANEATSTSKEPTDAWIVRPDCLIDGDRTTGTSSWQKARYTSMTVTFDRERIFSKLVFVVNGVGTYPGSYGAISFSSISENNYWFHVYLLDADGNTVKDLGNYQSWNANENQEIIIDLNYVSCSQIKVTLDNQYNNYVGLWEMEAYEHVDCEYDTLKETLIEETCSKEGKGTFECECGKTEEKAIPPTGIHSYTDIDTLTYENGFLAKGRKTLGCPTCDDYISDEVPPLFKFLGYSVSRNGKSICTSYVVNKQEIIEYETVNETTVDYGFLCAVTDKVTPLNANGTVADGINGQSQSLKETAFPRFDIKISANDWTNVVDTPLIMCAYVIDGDKLYYICSDTNTDQAMPISYNQVSIMPI